MNINRRAAWGPNEYDASKERRALNHLLRNRRLSRAQTATERDRRRWWYSCTVHISRCAGLTVKFQGSVSAREPRAAGLLDTSILCRYANVQWMREVAGEFVAAELDSRHSVDRERRIYIHVYVCIYMEEEGERARESGVESESDSVYSKTE